MKNISYIKDIAKWKSEFSFYSKIKVRFSETDMFGHMNNVSAFTYFEQARIEFLAHIGFSLEDKDIQGVPIVADLQCDFHRQIFFDEELKVYVKANHVGTSSIDIHYMVINPEGQVCLTGRGALVYIDVTTQKPTPIPEEMRKKLLNN